MRLLRGEKIGERLVLEQNLVVDLNGDVDEAVQSMIRRGGFLVAPSGTCFARLREDERYRRAVLAADLAIADSGLMVLLCRLFRRENLQRISGLKY